LFGRVGAQLEPRGLPSRDGSFRQAPKRRREPWGPRRGMSLCELLPNSAGQW
jgi:hypothetical protein